MTSRRPGSGDENASRRPRTPDELDALLGGGASGDESLDRLVAAARAPGRADELTGLDAALDAALGAPLTPASRTRRALARLGAATAATKITALSAVGAAAIGGVVVAGATGHLPGQHRGPAGPHATSATAPVTAAPPTGGPSGRAPSSPRASGTFSPSPTSTTTTTTLAPGDSVPTLCRQWLALPPGSDTIRNGPRFAALVQAAGGVGEVTGYCLRQGTGASPSTSPSGSGPRSSSPSGVGSSTRSATATATRAGSARTSHQGG